MLGLYQNMEMWYWLAPNFASFSQSTDNYLQNEKKNRLDTIKIERIMRI